jgi:hypothetical protein
MSIRRRTWPTARPGQHNIHVRGRNKQGTIPENMRTNWRSTRWRSQIGGGRLRKGPA